VAPLLPSLNVTPREAHMGTINHTYNPTKPYAELMKGRPEESASWQSIAVYSRAEYDEFRGRGWKPAREFMNSADRARRRD
jgi:hypothetical protein